MAQADLTARYVEELNRALKGLWPSRARILDEVGGHLEDAVQAEVKRGSTLAQAEASAVARIGSVEKVARAFAEQRLGQALASRVGWVPVVAMAFLASAGLESLFPPVPLFHSDEPVAGVERLILTGWVLQAAMVPLLVLVLALQRRGSVYAASNAFCALFCAGVLGPFAVGLGRLCLSLATVGQAASAPLMIRVVAVLGVAAAAFPVFIAQDAFSATRRQARRAS